MSSQSIRLRATTWIGLAAGLALVGTTSAAFAFHGERLVSKAKITMEQATAIALKTRPGKITDKELEKESGGSGLRYSFDIKSGNRMFEVGVDALDGKVLENKIEGPKA